MVGSIPTRFGKRVSLDFGEVIAVDETFSIIGINGLELNTNGYIGGRNFEIFSLILKR